MTSARVARERRRAARERAPGEVYQPPAPAALNARLIGSDNPGEHLWVMTAAWRVSDPERAFAAAQGSPDDHYLLDAENILVFGGPGCFKCETLYSPELAGSPCDESAV